MARVTIKELQEQLKKRDDIIQWQEQKIQELQNQNESILKNKEVVSKEEYEALSKQFNSLQINYKTLKELYEHEKEKNGKLINKCTELENKLAKVEPKHNERGAGRKSILTDEQLKKVQELHGEGVSYGAIAKEVELSKAYVYKLINKQGHSTNKKKYTEEDIERINKLRKGLREMGHTHSLTKDLE